VTKGSENPTVICDNCNAEINKKNYDLHVIYCSKNITKCPYCKVPQDIKTLQEHIQSVQGSTDKVLSVVEEGNIDELKQMHVHGFDFDVFKNESDNNNTIMHYAVKKNQKEIIEFLLI